MAVHGVTPQLQGIPEKAKSGDRERSVVVGGRRERACVTL